MAEPSRAELPIIEAPLDLIRWFIPLLNRLPRSHKFALGSEITQALYGLLRGLVKARYSRDKLPLLEPLAADLEAQRRGHEVLDLAVLGEHNRLRQT